MYHFIRADYNKGDLHLKGFEDSEKISDKLLDGEKSNVVSINLNIVAKTGRKPDYLIGTGLPIVSEKIRQILEREVSKTYQYIDTNLEGYFLLHVVGLVKCFDWENSIYTKHPPFLSELQDRPDKVEKLVLNKAVEGLDIFRMYEEPVTLFISDRLKGIFEKNGVTGVEYKTLSEYRKGIIL